MSAHTNWSIKLPRKKLFIAFVQLAFLFEISDAQTVQKPESPPTGKQAAFFETEIRPLLSKNCYGCHGPKKQKSKLRVDSRKAMIDGGDSGGVIEPGHPEDSLLIDAVERQEDQMPPGKRLTEQEIAALRKWIQLGAPWPQQVAPRKILRFSDAEKKYWAFQPLSKPEPVRANKDHWSRQPLDTFVWKDLRQSGLEPAPKASRMVLMRRVYFDLIGLPPTPEEQQTFLSDESPNAYRILVDRLLADPRYGEKWARHWLDLVRYAESDGYKQDGYRPNAWRYRDYVIESFNKNKPYDEFVLEQLAGDELDRNDPENLVATGYLRHWIYEYNQRDVRTQWDTILNDVTNVTGDVFLALSMNCARCHDHKFDPILQKDYFRLKAFFAPLDPRDDLPLGTPNEIEQFRKQNEKWLVATAAIREEIDQLERPHHQRKMKPEINKFPLDIRPMMKKANSQRSPFESQLSKLAYRQVKKLTPTELEKRLKGKAKERWQQLRKELAKFDSLKPKPLPLAFTATDIGNRAPATFIDGDTSKKIKPGILSVIDPSDFNFERTRIASHTTGRRLALAEWIVSPSNTLTSRVIVNRIWQYHFGKGIVASASDFGKLGQPPVNLDLLDFLSRQFMSRGWRLKALHRDILLSATYQQSATKRPHHKLRPFQQVVRRLEAEQIRDAMLAVSGELDEKRGGPGSSSESLRRTIYNKVIRNKRDPLLDAFDSPDNFNSTSARNVTTTPTQSLLMINGSWTATRASAMAKRLQQFPSGREQVSRAYQLAFCREPSATEVQDALDFLLTDDDAKSKSLVDFCHVLLNSNEFLYVD